MIASPFHRRRTERFARLIDEAGGARRHHARSGSDRDLGTFVSLSRRLSDLPMTVESSPEFREGLRAVLMATIEREGIGATAQPEESGTGSDSSFLAAAASAARRRTRRRARTFGAIVASLATGVIALSGVSVASDSAGPNDPLYALKRSTERAQLAMSGSDVNRGQLLLDFAKTRFDEAKSVTDDPAKFVAVLDEMDSETKDGTKLLATMAVERRDGAPLDAIDEFVTDQRGSITKLTENLSGQTESRAEASLTLLTKVAGRSSSLQQILPCGSDATGGTDDLGPTVRQRCNAPKPGDSGGATVPPTADGTGPATLKATPPSGAPTDTATTDPAATPAATPNSLVDTAPLVPPVDDGTLKGNINDITGGTPTS